MGKKEKHDEQEEKENKLENHFLGEKLFKFSRFWNSCFLKLYNFAVGVYFMRKRVIRVSEVLRVIRMRLDH